MPSGCAHVVRSYSATSSYLLLGAAIMLSADTMAESRAFHFLFAAFAGVAACMVIIAPSELRLISLPAWGPAFRLSVPLLRRGMRLCRFLSVVVVPSARAASAHHRGPWPPTPRVAACSTPTPSCASLQLLALVLAFFAFSSLLSGARSTAFGRLIHQV